ncbi:MAG: MFS transporter [Candidatus Micrarchaeota archaeon]
MNELNKTFAAVFFYSILAGIFIVGFPLYLGSLGITLEGTGLIFGVAALVSGFIKVGLSAWSDVKGRKKLTSLAAGMTAVTTGGFVFASTFLHFLILKPFYDFFYSFYFSFKYLRVMDLSPVKQRGKQLALFFAVFGFAGAIGMFLAGLLASSFGFPAMFLAAAVLGAVSFLVTLRFGESANVTSAKVRLSLEVLKSKTGKIFAAAKVCEGISAALLYGFILPLFLQSTFSLSLIEIGFLLAGLWVLWAAASFLLRNQIDLRGAGNIILVCVSLAALAAFGLAAAPNVFAFVVAFLVLDNITYSLIPGAMGTLASMIPKKENLGRDVLIFDYFYYFGSSAGLFLAGFLASVNYSWAFAARGVFLISMVVFVKMLPRSLEGLRSV